MGHGTAKRPLSTRIAIHFVCRNAGNAKKDLSWGKCVLCILCCIDNAALLTSILMRDLWTCAGRAFGYLAGRILRTIDGHHVGCLACGEIYGQDGFYGSLKETMDELRFR